MTNPSLWTGRKSMFWASLAAFLAIWSVAKRTLLLSSYALKKQRKYKEGPAISRFQWGMWDCVQGETEAVYVKAPILPALTESCICSTHLEMQFFQTSFYSGPKWDVLVPCSLYLHLLALQVPNKRYSPAAVMEGKTPRNPAKGPNPVIKSIAGAKGENPKDAKRSHLQ